LAENGHVYLYISRYKIATSRSCHWATVKHLCTLFSCP